MSKSSEAAASAAPEARILEDAAAPAAQVTPAAPEAKLSKIERDGLTLTGVYGEYKTTSAVIRALWAKGYTRSEISAFTGKRYQHVRNVLVQDAQKAEADAKKAQIAAAQAAPAPTTTTESK